VIRWFGTNTDTTEIKEAEEKLVEYQQELEAKVEERTKDLFERNKVSKHKIRNSIKPILSLTVSFTAPRTICVPLKSMLGLIAIVKESEDPRNTDQIKG
jgi:hypothetical protein